MNIEDSVSEIMDLPDLLPRGWALGHWSLQNPINDMCILQIELIDKFGSGRQLQIKNEATYYSIAERIRNWIILHEFDWILLD